MEKVPYYRVLVSYLTEDGHPDTEVFRCPSLKDAQDTITELARDGVFVRFVRAGKGVDMAKRGYWYPPHRIPKATYQLMDDADAT